MTGKNLGKMKKELRRTFSLIRKSIPPTLREAYSRRIGERLWNSSLWRKSAHIALYYSIGAEVDTIGIIKKGWQENKTIYLPKSDRDQLQLHFYPVAAFDQLSQGSYGIPEPEASGDELDVGRLDLVLIPGLAFDCKGYRLGYGGGYYDRFLALLSMRTVKIGLAYECQLSKVPLPREPFDQPVDMIITEQGVHQIRPLEEP